MSLLMRRRMLIAQSEQKTGVLPSAYQQVDYIQSTGTQYIITDFIANQDTRVVVEFAVMEKGGVFIFGARVSASSNAYTLNMSSQGTQPLVSSYGNSGNIQLGTLNIDNKYKVDKNKNITTLYDGDTVDNEIVFDEYTFTTPNYLNIFACHSSGKNGAAPSKMKLYSFKIYDNGTLARDYIPCYLKSDNIIGMYDIVNNIFYTNQGTGTFLKGADV